MKATASRPKASVRYSFSSTASVPRRMGFALVGEVGVGAAEETEVFLEAAFVGWNLARAEVPFADQAGDVAEGPEAVGDGGFVTGRPCLPPPGLNSPA